MHFILENVLLIDPCSLITEIFLWLYIPWNRNGTASQGVVLIREWCWRLGFVEDGKDSSGWRSEGIFPDLIPNLSWKSEESWLHCAVELLSGSGGSV